MVVGGNRTGLAGVRGSLNQPAGGMSPSTARWSRRSAARGVVTAIALWLGALVGRGDVVVEVDVGRYDPRLRIEAPGHTAAVRALAFTPDSTELVSAGEDKVALVWKIPGEAAGLDRLPPEPPQRRLRWSVGNDSRGLIKALAAAPAAGTRPPLVASAGFGAYHFGEIAVVDAASGEWVKTLGGHEWPVQSLEFTADGRWLVSHDRHGKVLAWRTDTWNERTVVDPPVAGAGDAAVNRQREAALESIPDFHPLAIAGESKVVVPVIDRWKAENGAEVPVFRIRIVDLDDGPPSLGATLPIDLNGACTALAASADGKLIAAADLDGNAYLIDTETPEKVVRWRYVTPEGKTVPVRSLAVLADEKTVVVGLFGTTGNDKKRIPPRLDVRRIKDGTAESIASRELDANVVARVSPDGRWLASTGRGDGAVIVEPTAELMAEQPPAEVPKLVLGANVGSVIGRLAFSTKQADDRMRGGKANPPAAPAVRQPPRRFRFSRGSDPPDPNRAPSPSYAFDIEELDLQPLGNGDDADWAPAAGKPQGWSLGPAAAPNGKQRWELSRDGRRAGIIDLDLKIEGEKRAEAWLPASDGKRIWGIAIGTNRGIFVYRLTEKPGAPCQLVRWFRGHEGWVETVAVTEDGRWLGSGGSDGTVLLWSLPRIDRDLANADSRTINRWGAVFHVEGGRAVVAEIDDAGPLAGRGVARGDVITQIKYRDSRGEFITVTNTGEVIDRLGSLSVGTQVTFFVSRDGERRTINKLPAWEPIAGFSAGADQEWRFWSPRGYYAASINGDTGFGWLINRGIDKKPEFFAPKQFRRVLERPRVMARLLREGSLVAALREEREAAATGALLGRLAASAPRMAIESAKVANGTMTVVAEVLSRADDPIEQLRLTTNGIAAPVGKKISEVVDADGWRRRREEFTVGVREGVEQRVKAFAATLRGLAATDEQTSLNQQPAAVAPEPPRPPPRLHVVAAGVVDYPLKAKWEVNLPADRRHAMDDANDVCELIRNHTPDIAAFDPATYFFASGEFVVLDQLHVTRAGWQQAIERVGRSLDPDKRPDDLLVVYLAGWESYDTTRDSGYVFLCSDATFADSAKGVVPVSGVLGPEDFQLLADLPCRKILLLDTSFAGADDGGFSGERFRGFQQNEVGVLSAAGNGRLSFDGVNDSAFVDTLRSVLVISDGVKSEPLIIDENAIVLHELVDYVVRTVPLATQQEENEDPQRPVWSPHSLGIPGSGYAETKVVPIPVDADDP